jgi:hypothetical protein
MPEVLGDHLGANAGRQRQRGVGVPKAMQRDGRQLRLLDQLANIWVILSGR